MKWKGKWRFNNAMHRLDGQGGTMTVEANDAAEARETIRDEVSRELFDTTTMQTYVVVMEVHEVVNQ
jgi:hypothetical protein